MALARALVNRPQVLLLDEPLGALDLKLRRAMQLELKQLQREVGVTFVFVTHDQEEALTMSDRIAVFGDGRVEQVATPAELYERPATPFVAGFVGTSNLLTGDVARSVLGRAGSFSIRPEKIHLDPEDGAAGPGQRTARGKVSDVVYLGSVNHYLVELEAGPTVTVLRQNLHGTTDQAMARRGEAVTVGWADEHVIDSRTTPRRRRSHEADQHARRRDPDRAGHQRLRHVSSGDGGGGGSTGSESQGGFTAPDVPMAEELGDTEGSLSVLAWPGYAEDGSTDKTVDWVTPFEQETGCQVDVKYFGTSDEAVSLMKSGQYDVVSASGGRLAPTHRRR